MKPRFLPWIALAASTLFILIASLHVAGDTLPRGWSFALTTGEAGLAELLQNLILFIPLGLSLALAGIPVLRAVAIGALLSLSVEFAQQWIPGRDPSLGDIICNTTSTAIGAGLVRLAPRWLTVSPDRSGRHALGAALLAVLMWFGTAAVLKPTFGSSPYQVVPRPDWNFWGRYRGAVTEATLVNGLLYVKATFPNSPPRRPCPLAAVMNAQGQPATILAIAKRDLTMRYHMPAVTITLEQPDLRWDDILNTIAPGDTFTASTGHEGGHLCLALNTSWRCDLGYTIGDGWKLIFYPEHWAGWVLAVINALWVAGWTVGVGYWAGRTSLGGEGRRRAAKVAVAIVLLGMVIVPMTTHLKGSSLLEWVGALAGIELGLVLGSQSWKDLIHRSA